jgi:hypothetical protein
LCGLPRVIKANGFLCVALGGRDLLILNQLRSDIIAFEVISQKQHALYFQTRNCVKSINRANFGEFFNL